MEKFASRKATRPSSPASIAARIMRIPAISRAQWPTVIVTPSRASAAISSPSSSVLAMGFSI